MIPLPEYSTMLLFGARQPARLPRRVSPAPDRAALEARPTIPRRTFLCGAAAFVVGISTLQLEYARAGALISYGPNLADSFARAAIYVDRIPKGANPAEMPIEQPTTIDLVINLKTARALGLTIPPKLMILATELME